MLDFSIKLSNDDFLHIIMPGFNPSYVGFFDKTICHRSPPPASKGFNPSYVGFFDKTRLSFCHISSPIPVSILLMLDFSIKLDKTTNFKSYPSLCFNPSYVGFFDKTKNQR